MISKAFESLNNLHFGQLFTYHENQFGFSVGGDCNKAILLLITLLNILGIKTQQCFLVSIRRY